MASEVGSSNAPDANLERTEYAVTADAFSESVRPFTCNKMTIIAAMHNVLIRHVAISNSHLENKFSDLLS